MKKLFLIFIILFYSLSVFSKQEADSTFFKSDSLENDTIDIVRHKYKRSWFLVPMGFYQEETSVGVGVTGGYYFKSNDLSKISSISGSVIYTLLNQAKVNVNPRFFLADNKVYIGGNVDVRHYPERYFGISNTETDINIAYTGQSFNIRLEPFYLINKNLQVGAYFHFRGERILQNDSVDAMMPIITERYGNAGWNPYFMFGLGAQFVYDTRDNQFYPQKFSNFLKFSAITYNKKMGSDFNLTALTLDFRQYIPTWVGQVFAYQLYTSWNIGRETPFQMLPSIGGADKLRGFRDRKFINNTSFFAQFEYRIPVWWRLKAAIFCSVGDVMDMYNPQINKLKVGYGIGFRCRLNEARVNLRFDLATNNYGEFKFYITATEAF